MKKKSSNKNVKQKRRKSLVEKMIENNNLLSIPSLRDTADTFKNSKDELINKNFPRTIDTLKIVSKSGKRSSISEQIFDQAPCCESTLPTDVNMSMIYNQLDIHNLSEKYLRYFKDDYSWIGWLTCATLAQHPLISRACSIPGEDAVAVGYNIAFSNDDAKEDEQEAKRVIKLSKRMGINQSLRKFDANKRIFGIGICIPCFESDSEQGKLYIKKMLENPFNIDAVTKNDIRYTGMKVVDPYWLSPQFNEESGFNPISKNFYNPEYWQIGSTNTKIHRSWCITFVNTIVADVMKPTYYYGGIPLPQMLMRRVYSADKVADEAQMLAMSKRLLVVDANIQKLIAKPKEAAKVMDAIKYARDNWGVYFKNPNSAVQQVDTYITEFNQLIMTQYQLVASIAQIPAPKLLKVMPTGFSDVSELVWKDYAQHIGSIQEDEYEPILDMHYMILFAKEGKKNIDFEISFNPVDIPTLMEKAKISELETKSAKLLIENGVLAPEEVRCILRSKKGGIYCNVSKNQNKNAIRKNEFDIEKAKISAKATEESAKITSSATKKENKTSKKQM